MRTERALQRFLMLLVASPGLASGAALLVSFLFTAPAIAAREHLGPFAPVVSRCAGCTLCGMSRAFASPSHGQLDAAVAFNPGVLLLWPLAWVVLGVSAFGLYRLRRHPVRFIDSRATTMTPTSAPAASATFSNAVVHSQETS